MTESISFTFCVTLKGEITLGKQPSTNWSFTRKVISELLLRLFQALPPINLTEGSSIKFENNHVQISNIRKNKKGRDETQTEKFKNG
ncbi:MAG: hypothetical protein CFH06_00297 [Alphaproteobacteria bacterium MarineAlpha3_Bin5]|nr:hypothetical protein [Magnetovibrio sp.]PPR79660.1 MAG: hypothetical protein CFH06_00297 [Alphaproteobacteria bacterium MarineAlpha3_Bin5]